MLYVRLRQPDIAEQWYDTWIHDPEDLQRDYATRVSEAKSHEKPSVLQRPRTIVKSSIAKYNSAWREFKKMVDQYGVTYVKECMRFGSINSNTSPFLARGSSLEYP